MTEDMLDEYDTSVSGELVVTGSYCGKAFSFLVTVNDIDVTDINITGSSNTLRKGQEMQLKSEKVQNKRSFVLYFF